MFNASDIFTSYRAPKAVVRSCLEADATSRALKARDLPPSKAALTLGSVALLRARIARQDRLVEMSMGGIEPSTLVLNPFASGGGFDRAVILATAVDVCNSARMAGEVL